MHLPLQNLRLPLPLFWLPVLLGGCSYTLENQACSGVSNVVYCVCLVDQTIIRPDKRWRGGGRFLIVCVVLVAASLGAALYSHMPLSFTQDLAHPSTARKHPERTHSQW